ncbi:MAG: pitrilysin family protein [Minisyncoccia bacterium]
MQYTKTTLKNGLRVITVPTKGNPSVTVMVMVEAGSNYETKEQNGLSHFLEHMCFKGTTKRPTILDISLEFDNIGAYNNAFTSNEYTGYYAKAEKRHFTKLLDIISDMYLDPLFKKEDIEKERGVILQEISMNEDKPDRQVWWALYKLMYGETPEGRPVIGPKENIKKFTREDFINYRKKHYVAEGTIVVVSGDVNPKLVEKSVEKYFSNISTAKKAKKGKIKEAQKTPAILIKEKDTDQIHMAIAFRSYKVNDKRTPTLAVLAQVLGGGFSSRLYRKIRTEMGACYYIISFNDPFTDHGMAGIVTGIEKSRINEVIKAILNEFKLLTTETISEKELQKTKDYMIGHLYMGLETTDSLATFYATEEATAGKVKTLKEMENEIRKVTVKDIQKVAKELFKNETLNLAVVGKGLDKKSLQKILKI